MLAGAGLLAFGSPSVQWRMRVVALVATGQIPDLGLADAVSMLRPSSGFWLESLPDTHSAYASISNAYTAATDLEAGAAAFRSDCSACHGTDAKGREHAPALIGRALTHGDSDWALYRTVKYGITGTAMPAHAWDSMHLWQTVAYVRSLETAAKSDPAAATAVVESGLPVSYEDLAAVDMPANDWLMYSGSYSSIRHSKLSQINRDTIFRLAPRWIYQFPDAGENIEASPLVRDGSMYIAHAGRIVALDARNGVQIWEYRREVPPDIKLCCANATRGLALLGDRLFVGTLDAHLLAVSARTGARLWDKLVADDYRAGYSITGAPLAFRDLVVTGISGGDFPTRGFIAAFDAQTGKERWKFWTVPAPGMTGNETWAGDSWRKGGGGSWLTGSYDPKLDLLYWGVGNAAPDFNAASRKGDNLYTNSVLALRGTTGEKVWHFQFTPGDDHDWDSVQIPVLADRPDVAAPHQILWANRNGFFYVLNRETGQFLSGTPFVRQTWAERLTETGRPVRVATASPSPTGSLVYPSVTGGTLWWSPSYDPQLDLMVVPAVEHGGLFFSVAKASAKSGEAYLSGATGNAPGLKHYSVLRALNPSNGSVVWERRGTPTTEQLHLGGVMTTQGGLAFASDNRLFFALDTRDGKLLWSFPTGGRIVAAPISFAIDGTQYVAIASGHSIMTFALVDAGR